MYDLDSQLVVSIYDEMNPMMSRRCWVLIVAVNQSHRRRRRSIADPVVVRCDSTSNYCCMVTMSCLCAGNHFHESGQIDVLEFVWYDAMHGIGVHLTEPNRHMVQCERIQFEIHSRTCSRHFRQCTDPPESNRLKVNANELIQ